MPMVQVELNDRPRAKLPGAPWSVGGLCFRCIPRLCRPYL